jgi:signal transduction histidine kinase
VLWSRRLPAGPRPGVEFCARGSNVRCDVRIDGGLWPVEVDCGQLEQMIGNLVINAKQAMPRGGTVVVHAGNVGGALHFTFDAAA